VKGVMIYTSKNVGVDGLDIGFRNDHLEISKCKEVESIPFLLDLKKGWMEYPPVGKVLD
jgi:hypothetical protein